MTINFIEAMDKEKIRSFYELAGEKDRLELELFKLEGMRTKEIISRYFGSASMTIADIGGGAGYYSFWLQSLGHKVSLIDLSPKNIELAKSHAQRGGITLDRCTTGDATRLDLASDYFDLVLLLGPLYHLTDRKERIKALSEAKRIVRPGGWVLSAVISRYGSLFDGFRRDLVQDEQFEKILVRDLETGVHLNETNNPEYFTTAYFHSPAEIKEEIKESGLQLGKLVAVESFGWIIDNFQLKSSDPSFMKKLNRIVNMVECNDDIIAMSPHIIAIAQKN